MGYTYASIKGNIKSMPVSENHVDNKCLKQDSHIFVDDLITVKGELQSDIAFKQVPYKKLNIDIPKKNNPEDNLFVFDKIDETQKKIFDGKTQFLYDVLNSHGIPINDKNIYDYVGRITIEVTTSSHTRKQLIYLDKEPIAAIEEITEVIRLEEENI